MSEEQQQDPVVASGVEQASEQPAEAGLPARRSAAVAAPRPAFISPLEPNKFFDTAEEADAHHQELLLVAWCQTCCLHTGRYRVEAEEKAILDGRLFSERFRSFWRNAIDPETNELRSHEELIEFANQVKAERDANEDQLDLDVSAEQTEGEAGEAGENGPPAAAPAAMA